MAAVEKIDMRDHLLDIHSNLSVTARQTQPGPPKRMAGMTVGVVTVQPGKSPHSGEMHPDGDEILYVISGTLQVSYDSGTDPLILEVGEACIIPEGEWHLVDCLEETTLMHITPGPNGQARFN